MNATQPDCCKKNMEGFEMKKILSVILALSLFLTLAVSTASAEDLTLDVIIAQYGPNTQEWFLGKGMDGSNFVEKFEAANPGIKLNLEVVSWNDLYTVVSTRISNNNAPDILNIDVFADYANEGLLLPVKDYCPEDLYQDFFPSFIEQSVIDGTVWAVPDLASARAMFYNVDLLQEAGVEKVPETWAELEDASQAIIDAFGGEVYPWGIDMTTDEGQAAFAYYTWGNKGGFVDENGEWALNSDANVAAIEYAIKLVSKGFTNPNPATQTRYDLQDMFAAGKMAMLIAPNQLPTYVADKEGKVNLATAGIPHAEGATSSSVGVMDRIMAFKDDSADQAARNEAIGKFLSFFYDPVNYVGWVSMEGFLPAVNSAVGALVESDPSFQAWLDVLGGAKFYPTTKAEWNDVKQGVIEVEQQALTGGNVKELLDALQAKITGK